MIIKITLLKGEEPKRLEATYDAQELDLEFVDFRYVKEILLQGTAERVRQTLMFRGTLDSRIEQVCARCLESTESDFSAPFELSYDIANKELIDTTDDLRDILILGRPERFLCRVDCLGICAHCGVNLNREKCRCQRIPNKVPGDQKQQEFEGS